MRRFDHCNGQSRVLPFLDAKGFRFYLPVMMIDIIENERFSLEYEIEFIMIILMELSKIIPILIKLFLLMKKS